jgi:hypothetical protein
MEDYHITTTNHGLERQHGMRWCGGAWFRRWQHGSEIVFKIIDLLIVFVLDSASTMISWTKITFWIVFRQIDGLRSLVLAKPRPLHAMRRHKDVLIGQGIHLDDK